MRKLLLFLALITAPALTWANQSARGWCELGGQVVVTSGLNSTTTVQASYPACTVTVNVFGGGLATIFSDNAGTPLANPFTATSSGQWTFFAANGHYTVTLTGGGLPSPVALSDILLNDPTGPTSFVGTFFSTASANPAQSGVFRLASADIGLCWRNNANSADICFTKDSGDVVHLNTSLTLAGLTSSAEAAPSVTGVALGDATHRWDAFIRNLDVSGTITGILNGSGTTNTIPKFTAATVIGNSSVTDDGTTVSTTEAVSLGGNVTATAGQNTLNFYQANNRIYVDGVKYPLTHAGIQQALTDACTVGNALGTVVYFPPQSYSGAGFTLTCPLSVRGAGKSATFLTATSGDLFTLSPSANFSQNQQWEFTGLNMISASGNVIKVNGCTFQLTNLYVHDNEIDPQSATGIAVTNTGTCANEGFDWKVVNNSLLEGGGVILVQDAAGHGVVDGLLVADNYFGGGNPASTLPCINLTTGQGSAQETAFHNRGGCPGGFLISHGTQQCKILYNQIEQPSASTEANSAIIDLMGDTYTVGQCDIVGNNINAHAFAINNIRLDHTTDVLISGNVITENPAGVGILTTASTNPYFPLNNYYNGGGTNLSGSGTAQYNFSTQSFAIGNIMPGQRVMFNSANTGFEYQFLNAGSGAAGAQLSGSDWFENAGPGTSAAGHARMWADSSSHTFKANNNAGSTFSLTETIASGTATMPTALIAAGACGTTVTVAATGVATTDAIIAADNAAVGANPGVLIINKWPTANNVNFNYCNPTAAGVTPSAATLNWRVTR